MKTVLRTTLAMALMVMGGSLVAQQGTEERKSEAKTEARPARSIVPPSTPINLNDERYGTMNLQTSLGSFKFREGEGRAEISFSGTLMISQLQGTHTITGNVRKEYEDRGRVAYFGTGRVVIQGRWRAIQWFGRNMRATWRGFGLIQLFGEFDRNLQTGRVWYTDPEAYQEWGTFGMTLTNPQRQTFGTGTPVPRRRGN